MSQHQLRADAGIGLSAQFSSQAKTHINAYDYSNTPFHSSQPIVPFPSQPTTTQACDVSYFPGTSVGGVNAGVCANVGLNVGASASCGAAGLATEQTTAQVTQEPMQPAIQQTTQTAAELDIVTGNTSGQVIIARSLGQYDAGFVSGQTQGQAIGVTILRGSEDVQGGSVVKGQVVCGSTQGVGQVSSVQQTTQVAAEQAMQITAEQMTQETTQSSIQAQVSTETTQAATELNVETADTSGPVTATGSSGQYGGSGVTVGLNAGTGVTLEINADAGASVGFSTGASTNVGFNAAGSSGQTAQVTTDQITQQTTGVVTQQSTQTEAEANCMTGNTSSRQVAWESTRGVGQSLVEQTTQSTSDKVAQVSAEVTTQSSTQQTTQTSAELNVEVENANSLVIVARPSTQYGGKVSKRTQGLTTGRPALLPLQGIVQQGSLLGSDQLLPAQTRQLSSQQVSTETMQSSIQQNSTELDIGTKNTSSQVTIAGSGQYGSGACVQTQEKTVGTAVLQDGEDVPCGSMTDQVARQGVSQSSSKDTTQSSKHQTTAISAGLDVGIGGSSTLATVSRSYRECCEGVSPETQGQAVGITILQEGKDDVQRGSMAGQVAWESIHGIGQSSSVQQIVQSSSQQILQVSTDETTQTSAGLDVGIKNSDALITVGGSSGQHDSQVSVQTQGQVVGVTILQGGEDVLRGSVTDQIASQSTQEVDQSSLVEQTTQSSSWQIQQTSTEATMESAYQEIAQTSTAETTESSQQTAQVTTEKTTTSTSQQIAQVSTEEKAQSPTQQTIQSSAEIDIEDSDTLLTTAESSGQYGGVVSEQMQGQALDVTVLRGGLDVQREVSVSSVEADSERIARDIQTSMAQDIQTSTQQITESSVQVAVEGSSGRVGVVTQGSTQEVTQVMTQEATQGSTQQLTQQESDVEQQSTQRTSFDTRLGGALSIAGPYATVVEAAEDAAVTLVQGAAGSYSRGVEAAPEAVNSSSTELVQENSSSSKGIVQISTESTTTQQTSTAVEASYSTTLGVVAETEQSGGSQPSITIVSHVAQNVPSAVVQGSLVGTEVLNVEENKAGGAIVSQVQAGAVTSTATTGLATYDRDVTVVFATAEEQLDAGAIGEHEVQASNTTNLSIGSGASGTYVTSQNASQGGQSPSS